LEDIGVDGRKKLKELLGVGVLSLGIKRLRPEVSHSAPLSAEVNND
jgi:hypothetical protein